MRYKYETRGIVLSRSPLGEANTLITLLTPDLGMVRARAQGLRIPGAKLGSALTTFAESDVVLVRGKESWRVAGAVLIENWFIRLDQPIPRARGARVSNLLLRLVAEETRDPTLFSIIRGFFDALATLSATSHEAAEVLAALHVLAALGFDAGEIPSSRISSIRTPEGERNAEGTRASIFAPEQLDEIMKNRIGYIARINNGITASGL